jgi:hypothetical protein
MVAGELKAGSVEREVVAAGFGVWTYGAGNRSWGVVTA